MKENKKEKEKADREIWVLERLCRAIGGQLGERCKLQSKRESPDAIISIGPASIGLELVEYVVAGKEIDVEAAEKKLTEKLKAKWIENRELGHWNFQWKYHVSSNGDYMAPRLEEEQAMFVSDLARLGKYMIAHFGIPSEHVTNVRLRQTESGAWRMRTPQRIGRQLHLSLPMLSKVCHEIECYGSRGWTMDNRSNLSSGYLRSGAAHISGILTKKLRLFESYQAALPGTPIWLAIYSMGYPVNRFLPEPLLEEALGTARSVCYQASTVGYRRILWFDSPGIERGGNLNFVWDGRRT
ncbi:MAG: hypothetical protein GY930_00935 [bacterium]|nr:hypothetical protein [bacterium]